MAVADVQICACALLRFGRVKHRTTSPTANVEKSVLNGAEMQ